MFTSLENGTGLEVVIWLQAHSSPALNALARVLDTAGLMQIYFVLIVLLYWRFDRRWALRCAAFMLLASLLVTGSKFALARPRPYQVAPERVRALVIPRGYGIVPSYGFPSGHVTYALLFWGLLAQRSRRRWLVVWWLLIFGLQAWSRMALGVHYPQDVVGGALIGLLLLGLDMMIPAYHPSLAPSVTSYKP